MLAFLLPLFLLNIRITGDKIFNYKIFRAAISTLKKKKKREKIPRQDCICKKHETLIFIPSKRFPGRVKKKKKKKISLLV